MEDFVHPLTDPSLDYWRDFCTFVQNSSKEVQESANTNDRSVCETDGLSLLLDIGGKEAADLLSDNGLSGDDILRFIVILCKLEELCLLKVIDIHEKYKLSLSSADIKIDHQSANAFIVDRSVTHGMKEHEISYHDFMPNEIERRPSNFMMLPKIEEKGSEDIDMTDLHYKVVYQKEIQMNEQSIKIKGETENLNESPSVEINDCSNTNNVNNVEVETLNTAQNKVCFNQNDLLVRRSSRQIRVSSRYAENKEVIQNLLKPDLITDNNSGILEPPCICSSCKKTFSDPKTLVTHWKAHPNNKKKKKCLPFFCKTCKYECAYYSQLKIHYKRHDNSHIKIRSLSGSKLSNKSALLKESIAGNINNSPNSDKDKRQRNENEQQVRVSVADEKVKETAFTCKKCSKTFESVEDSENHNILCKNEENFKCKHCHRTFSDRKSRLSHQKSHLGHAHSKIGSYSQKLGQYHKRLYRKVGQFQCKVCNKCFKYERNLDFHTTLHTGEKPNVCEVCGKSFRMKRSLISHLRFHDKASHIQCDLCPKTFVDLKALEQHKLVHSGVKPYSCEACGKKFRRLLGLRNHRRLHKTEEAIKCDVCDKTFVDKWGMLKHKTIHTGEKPFRCSECGKAFRLKKGLMDHVKLHNKDSQLKCSLCPRTFVEQRKLDLHIMAHSGEKPFICDKCGKGFMNAMNLKVHNRCHTGEKPYKCSFCDRTFNQQGSLIAHERHHKGERPYVCDICGDSYITKSQLTIHIRKHSNDRPYKCDVCNYAAYTGSLLKIHKLKHSSEKPYKCLLCPSAFKRQHHLEVHSRTHIANNSDRMKSDRIIHKCPYCEDTFTSEVSLSSHIATHEIVVVTTETATDDIFIDHVPDEVAYNIVLL